MEHSQNNGSTGNEKIDALSSLPDAILTEILSYLPTDDAVASMLIQRFGQLWTGIHSFDFNLRNFSSERYGLDGPPYQKFVSFVRHVLNHHHCPSMKKLRVVVNFPAAFHEFTLKDLARNVKECINHAMQRNVEVLDLDFSEWDQENVILQKVYRITDGVINCPSLVELRLHMCLIELRNRVNNKSMKIIDLKGILILQENVIEQIVKGCPQLEELSIVDVMGPENITIDSQSLKRFHIRIFGPPFLELEMLCPNLKFLSLIGEVESTFDESFHDIAHADLDVTPKSYQRFDCISARVLLEEVQDAKVLEVGSLLISILNSCYLRNVRFLPMQRCKTLTIEAESTKRSFQGVTWLLKCCIELEDLEIVIAPTGCYLNEKIWLEALHIEEKYFWDSMEMRGFSCLMNSLKTVKIFASISEPILYELVRFLLTNALVLEKLMFVANGLPVCFGEMENIYCHLLSIPRASPSCKLVIEFQELKMTEIERPSLKSTLSGF